MLVGNEMGAHIELFICDFFVLRLGSDKEHSIFCLKISNT